MDSILFPGASEPIGAAAAPECFRDLALDQIVEAIVAGWTEYELLPFFYRPLRNVETVRWRQAVLRDLERPAVRDAIAAFAEGLRAQRRHLERATKVHYPREQARWFLNAASAYCDAVERLRRDLDATGVASEGLQAFLRYLIAYGDSTTFADLAAETRELTARLSAIRYVLLIRGGSVTVRPWDNEADFGAAVAARFEKFFAAGAPASRRPFPDTAGLNHVEAQVLEGVAVLNPEIFQVLDAYRARHADYLDPVIARFDREIHFYVAYLTHVEPLRRAGLSFCYPTVSTTSKAISGRQAFDLALAHARAGASSPIVTNDFALTGAERTFVVSGPNQGGKTTFARLVGQGHYLASLGLMVPGSDARLFLCDRIFTHFEREEDVATLHGKLEDDLVRLRHILDRTTSKSLVIMNELFSSTTAQDALDLGRRVMARLSALDAIGVWVTFLTELASFDEKTVSVVSEIDPRDPAIRTYKLARRPAAHLAYALALAEKYGVTYARLKARLPA